jgi:hypothetical protein
MSTTRRPGYASDRADRPFPDREQKDRARQEAEALFAPKPPPRVAPRPVDRDSRQRRILKAAPAVDALPPVEAAASPAPRAPAAPASIPPPHVARIRAWLKYGMTIAQVAEAYRVPITEIKRLLGKL